MKYFGRPVERLAQTATWRGTGGATRAHRFESAYGNIDESPLPFPDETFEFMLFCKLLEEFTTNELGEIAELHRVMRRDGEMVMTTPNVACSRTFLLFLGGRSLHDPCSGCWAAAGFKGTEVRCDDGTGCGRWQSGPLPERLSLRR